LVDSIHIGHHPVLKIVVLDGGYLVSALVENMLVHYSMYKVACYVLSCDRCRSPELMQVDNNNCYDSIDYPRG